LPCSPLPGKQYADITRSAGWLLVRAFDKRQIYTASRIPEDINFHLDRHENQKKFQKNELNWNNDRET
jgi:hypothetical protein